MSTVIQGKNYIGYSLSAENPYTFKAYVPVDDAYLKDDFHAASPGEVMRTMELAQKAFLEYAYIPPPQRANFLMAITEEILALGDELLERASLETGLPAVRLAGERARTITQLTQFADLLREGSWVEASIDTPIPDRLPAPKPDLRKMLVPIGPVVVFGSSNFPFAYSVAGVDTGPALAAGNPLIVKAHAAHPGVSDLTAQAVVKAAKRTGMPDGVFSMLYDDGFEVGASLVKHPYTKAVGFTGSFKGGMALYKMAQEREEPIPVFAEMGSVNPIIILPEYLKSNAENLAHTLAASVTLGAGQFCTNPGLVFVTNSDGLETFEKTYSEEILKTESATMLTAGICRNFYHLRDDILQQSGVTELALSGRTSESKTQSQASVAKVSGREFIENPKLQEEVFGPFSLLVVCDDAAELSLAISQLKGQLTTSVMGESEEIRRHTALFQNLSRISGRVIIRGVPTGVEVCPSMHHGGPFPASSDAKFTSVGRHSILRFVRPQSYQGWDNDLLPDELKNENPLGIMRLVNNKETRDTIQP
ncbi:Alpha-ketoglutaric semialdehyde dehydrogenase 2 [Dyadobacter sp. CECT 9275]|uniref:Alpha-ketoglutaric semialdehyde dehydrogenase 2 n=1 Tax=Dyadobacter helix TaxID=2822344 RepID=A0A916JBD5_9BACT|nr:aldehyde dehydrogenase (NADP(+)) [Dyadobacter sp. CECT 9275]CAG4993055.1 Alpha-ketoglutaric semialdehyde dehydrogenase 2 [Dyadobacter sp. CECT 9275]